MLEFEIDQEAAETSVAGLLAHHDQLVQKALSDVMETTTGTERVQALHVLRGAVSAHDSVVGSALCPLLDGLPGGPEVSGRLRRGCAEREALLARFQALSEGTAPRNVYPVFGPEIEAMLGELERSLQQHVEDETTRVGELLEAAAGSISPEVVASKMVMEAGRAPARAHRATYRHPKSRTLRALYRGLDRMHEWNDSHHGWPSTKREAFVGPVRPHPQITPLPPSIPDLLAGYDKTVEAIIAELADADQGPRRASAAYRLGAAVAIHDSIVEGTLCRLLDAVPESRAAAHTLRRGCQERARLLGKWNDLVKHASPSDLFETHAADADRIVDQLVASFEAHESNESEAVAAAVQQLRERPWKYRGTGSRNIMWVWPNPEPGVLAAHMALWAEKAPTRPHPFLSKHPTNRLLRNLYRYTDRLQDRRRSRRGWPALS